MKKILLLIVLFALVLAVSAGPRSPHGTKTKRVHHHWPKKPGICTIPNCEKCSSSSWLPTCDECDRGLVRVKVILGYACWKKCPQRYRNVNGTCTPAGIHGADCTPNCQKCRSMACSVCADGYALHRAFPGLKARCIRQCPTGYQKEVNPMGGHKCVRQCTPNCQKCRNMACSVCADGYALHRAFPGLRARCIRQCPTGYQKEVNPMGGHKCVRRCTPNCQKCQSMACSVCTDGYALHRDFSGLRARCIRQCPNGYKREVNPMGGYKCVRQCTSNCKKCKNWYSCSVCERGYVLFKRSGLRASGRCIRRCPGGYKTQDTPTGDKKCVKQCQVMDCAFCPTQGNKCFKCKPGLYKLPAGRSSDFCFSHCPSGYVPKTVNGVNVCKRYAPSTKPKGKPTAELTTALTTSTESISTKPESWTTPEATTITTEPESRPETAHTPEPATDPEPTIIDEEFWP